MDPISSEYIASILVELTTRVAEAGGRRLQRELQGDEAAQALERALEAGLVALLAETRNTTQAESDLLEEIFRQFFTDEDTAPALKPLLRGNPADHDDLALIFNEMGYDAATLAGLDFDHALQSFETAFIVAASEEATFQPLIQSGQLLEQTHIQREMLAYMKQLVDFIAQLAPGTVSIEVGQVSGHDVTVGTRIVHQTVVLPAMVLADWEAHYLRTLQRGCEQLDLALIDEEYKQVRGARPVQVSDVFTTLNLKGQGRRENETVEAWFKGSADPQMERIERTEANVPIQAIEAIGAVDRLVILGRPGGGKSTVVDHVTSMLATRRLAGRAIDGDLPGWSADSRPMPVHIQLRHLATWFPETGPIYVGLIWDYLAEQFKQMGCSEAFGEVKATLVEKGGIIFFDGLDEVREVDARQKRSRITAFIDEVAHKLPQCSMVVTCREYAYRQSDDWWLSPMNFPHVVELDGFNKEQIAGFVQTWFSVVGPDKGWDALRCELEVRRLISAIDHRKELGEMADSPLLLTLMAQVHIGGGGLPDDRADLYRRAVNLLLAHWENRFVREWDGSIRVESDSIMQLGLKTEVLRDALAEVAFLAHERQAGEKDRDKGPATIHRDELANVLTSHLGDAEQAKLVVDYIQERAGLLVAEGTYSYRFPHKTFQEYLSAIYLIQKDNWEMTAAQRVRNDSDWWREVYLWLACISRGLPSNVASLAHQLLGTLQVVEPVTSARSDAAQLVAHALTESGFVQHAERERPAARYTEVYEGTQQWLWATMRTSTLPATERAEAGRVLARLGDHRASVTDVDAMSFCFVPRGDFWLGAPDDDEMALDREQPCERYALDYDYWLAQYPVTQAQFAAFVADEGYVQARYWQLAAAAGYWSEAGFKGDYDREVRRAPLKYGEPYSLPNHPVVGVSWFEAMAFCDWLAERWQQAGSLPEGWVVRLPNEPEWEKGARGGVQIPQAKLRPCAVSGSLPATHSVDLQANPREKQRFPWGDIANSQQANYDESNIGTTNAVGCFADGASPYGIEEMSGNVWEWVRSAWGNDWQKPEFGYPYKPDDGREDLTLHNMLRVLRGGSFDDGAQRVRCAARDGSGPDLRYDLVGFRILVSPPL